MNTKHQKAGATGVGLAAAIAWGLSIAGIVVPAAVAIFAAGALAIAALAVGHRGIKGIALMIWRGDEDAPAPAVDPAPPEGQ